MAGQREMSKAPCASKADLRTTPQPTAPHFLSGTIDLVRPGESKALESVHVAANGRFRLSLPAGSYQLIGHPSNSSDPVLSRVFVVTPGRVETVDLVEIAT